MKIAIVGDSFSSDSGPESWINLLEKKYQCINFSQRGISQYKLLQIINQNLDILQSVDKVIVWYTNPDRIYISKDVDYPTRLHSTHKFADMLANDILNKKQWKNIAETYYRFFYNQELQDFISESVINQTRHLLGTKLVECSGFYFADKKIKSFFKMQKQYQGKVNHFDIKGNKIIYDWLTSYL